MAESTVVFVTGINKGSDPQQAGKDIEAAGINHIGVVIANAGISPTPKPLDVVDGEDVVTAFHVNAIGPIRIYRAVKPLLETSVAHKWISVSSAASSITNLDVHNASFVGSYGVSKAAQDWFTAEMGNESARMMGMDQAPTTVEESAYRTIEPIDKSTRE
ncbi:toxin biosynthesis [Colletotrichum plurivorum]|uniref:Toxin biosynthesis n=1 Tax=Colletotrichum plurivorum TaxID=2175906 RepID=A0A8H6N411_9PEZI|nr:toxin biosynthesis [Colletotrichum plurivorum]